MLLLVLLLLLHNDKYYCDCSCHYCPNATGDGCETSLLSWLVLFLVVQDRARAEANNAVARVQSLQEMLRQELCCLGVWGLGKMEQE